MPAAGAFESLAEAQLLTQSELVKGIIEEIIRDGGIIDRFPIKTVSGTNLVYNRENILPTGQFHAIADQWTASEDINLTQITTTLAMHGDQKDLDDFIAKTYDSHNDMMAVVTQQTSKGLKIRLENRIIYEATSFSGLHNLVTANQTQSVGAGAVGAACTVTAVNRMLDLVRPPADLLVGPFRLMQRLDQTSQGVNSSALVYVAAEGKTDVRLGHRVGFWRDVPVRRSDFMATANTGALQETIASGTFSAETGGATGSLFGIRFGQPEQGGAFLAMGNELFETVGPHESKDRNGQWFRIRSYIAPGIGSTRCLGRVDGCTDVAVTA